MVLSVGSIVVVAKHGDTIYTVQIDEPPAVLPGYGWMCHTKEGNWWLIRPSDTVFITIAKYFRTVQEAVDFYSLHIGTHT